MNINPFKKAESFKRIRLYVPEQMHDDVFSTWRKPQSNYTDNTDGKRREISGLKKLLTISTFMGLFLCLFIFGGVLMLLYGTDFDNTYLDNGSALSCVIESDGKVNSITKIRANMLRHSDFSSSQPKTK